MNRACFPKENHQNSQKWAKFMNFSFCPFLWFGLPGRLLSVNPLLQSPETEVSRPSDLGPKFPKSRKKVFPGLTARSIKKVSKKSPNTDCETFLTVFSGALGLFRHFFDTPGREAREDLFETFWGDFGLSVPKNRNRRKIAAFSNRKVLNRSFCSRNRRKIARKSQKKSQKNR